MGLKRKVKPVVSDEASRRGKKSRRKGASYERDIAKIFQKYTGYEFVRTPQSGGFMKKSDRAEGFRGDIVPVDKGVNIKFHIECKNQEKWNLKAWLEQAQSDCPSGRIPIVIMKKKNTNAVGKAGNQQNLVVIDLEDLLSLLDSNKIAWEED